MVTVPLLISKSNRNSFNLQCALLLGLMLLCSCTRNGSQTSVPPSQATHVVKDDAGRTLSLPVRPSRVVSLAPSLTEIVFAVGAGPRLVGDTSYCDYPEEAKRLTHVGDTLNPNIESIIGLKPDLVLVSTASQLEAFTRQLDQQHIPVYISDPRDLNAVLNSIETLGAVLGETERGQQVANGLRERAKAVEEKVANRRSISVFYQVAAEPLYTAGRDSFVTDLIRRAGGLSVTRDVPGGWPRYSNESALAARPEAVIIPIGEAMGTGSDSQLAESLKKSPAAVEGRVYPINGDLLSRPGPRLVDGFEQIARVLHPEAF
jgi:iron complex transport system substrate-binding protein